MAGEYKDKSPISKYDEIIESPDDSSGPLTFGVELEFLVAYLNVGVDDPDPNEERDLIRAGTYEEGSRKVLKIVQNGAFHISFRSGENDIYIDPHFDIPRYNAWRLVHDGSLNFTRSKDYTWMSKELTSEIMGYDNPDFYVSRITDVCRAVRQTRVHLNRTTGVHVHVGRGEESFSLITMKKFATFIWFADDLLLGLQHPYRRECHYCRPLHSASGLGKRAASNLLRKGNPLSEAQEEEMNSFIPTTLLLMQTLQANKSIGEMADLMSDPTEPGSVNSYAVARAFRGSVGFCNFMPMGKTGGNTHTFEFRQMAGSLEPDAIIHWARVCMAVVDFARLSDAPRFKDLIGKIVKGEAEFSAFDLLLELGLVEEEKYFRSTVAGYKSGKLGFFPGAEEGRLFLPKLE
ncbi:putative amidoligase enzyme-domain-containing protein [Hypoxylon crocopeplum]|nr:putative amidoligase enzyme-domain-containing protein [Hypoxylon crocopeplum]